MAAGGLGVTSWSLEVGPDPKTPRWVWLGGVLCHPFAAALESPLGISPTWVGVGVGGLGGFGGFELGGVGARFDGRVWLDGFGLEGVFWHPFASATIGCSTKVG